MGPENKNDYTVYCDGAPITLRGLPEITLPIGTPEPEGMLVCQTMEIVMHVKVPKRWRCRGRKRFIKLMMSEGISRNGAVWLADFIRKLMPYGEAWRQYALFNTFVITVG